MLGRRLEINSAVGRLEVLGNFSGPKYSITRDAMPAAALAAGKQFAVAVADGEDPVLMLAVVLVIANIIAMRQANQS